MCFSFTATDANGYWLGEDDYDCVYYAADGTELSEAPTEIGSYSFAIRAREGSGYAGESPAKSFRITSENDIGNTDRFYIRHTGEQEGVVAYTGMPVEAPAVSVNYYETAYDEDGWEYERSIDLEEGTDFVLDHYEDEYGNPLEQAPVEPGSYRVSYAGAGDYTGTRSIVFTVIDSHDLNYAEVDLGQRYVPLVDGMAIPQVKVTDVFGNSLEEGTDYVLAYTDDDGGSVEAPVAVGDHYVYARAADGSDYEGHTDSAWFTVYDPNDLSGFTDISESDVYLDERLFTYTGSPVYPYVEVMDDESGGELGSYMYSLVYYDADGNELDEAPIETGEYSVAARGRLENGYCGETGRQDFRILGLNDIGNSDRFSVLYTGYAVGKVAYTGNPVTPPSFKIFYYKTAYDELFGEYEGKVFLEEGTDYVLDHFEDEDGNLLEQAPIEQGFYRVVYAGTGDYTGTCDVGLTVVDPHDLQYAYIATSEPVLMEHGVATPQVTVTDLAGNALVEGTHYELRYEQHVSGYSYDRYDPVDAPTSAGEYRVYAIATDGSDYEGRTDNDYFGAYDPYDLHDFTHYYPAGGEVVLGKNMRLPTPHVDWWCKWGDYEVRMTPVEGTDYVLDHIEDEEGADLGTTLPRSVGSYIAVYRGIDPYHGTFSLGFNIYDPNDISGSQWYGRFWPSSRVVFSEDAHLPRPLIYRYVDDGDNSVLLTEGTDYVFDHFEDEEGTNLGTSMPREVGEYYAVYRGIGAYSGYRSLSFWYSDASNIGSYVWESGFLRGGHYETDGGPVELRKPYLYRASDGANGQTVRLEEGTDFVLDHFEAYSYEDEEYQVFDAAPSTPGEYYAVYKGIGSYTGTRRFWFEITTSYSLYNATLTLARTKYEETGSPVQLEAKVRDAVGIKLREGIDYTLVYWDVNEDEDEGTTSNEAPKEKGSYAVAAVAADGSRYVGSTGATYFTIGEQDMEPEPEPEPEPVPTPTGQVITLGEPADASAEKNSYWVGTFTAPKTGLYVFESEGEYDTYGHLYADAGLDYLIASDDDGGTNGNFRIVQSMEANQTVYLKVRQYSNKAFAAVVHVTELDATDLSNGYMLSHDSTWQDGLRVPQIKVIDALGNVLKEGTDYELEYRRYDYDTEEYVPAEGFLEVGSYSVRAIAKDGGAYKGSTSYQSFSVQDASDLSNGTLGLECSSFAYTGGPVVLDEVVCDRSGKDLEAGKDYDLVYYTSIYDITKRLDGAPSEPGSYWVVAVAADGSAYDGRTESASFNIYDPNDFTSSAEVYLSGYELTYNLGDESVPVFRLANTSVEPEVSVYVGDEELASDQYTVSYARNDVPSTAGSLASVTVTGKAPFVGSVTREFMVVDKYDLARLTYTQGMEVSVNGESRYVGSYDNNGNLVLAFKTDEGGVSPRVSFNLDMDDAPVQGRDYTVSLQTVDGEPIDRLTEEGKYKLVLTATEDGNCKGTGSIRFVLSSSTEMSAVNWYPSLHNSDAYSHYLDVDYGWYEENAFTDWIYDLADGAGQFWYDLFGSGVALAQNLDYVLTTVFDEAGGFFTYLFSGIGAYEGTVRGKVYVSQTAKDSFEGRGASAGAYVSVDDSGELQDPLSPYIEGLVYGQDYTFAGYVDAGGNAITHAAAEDQIYARFVGTGIYAGQQRDVMIWVTDNERGFDLNGSNVYPTVVNGARDYNKTDTWYLLAGTEPSVSLAVYQRNRLVFDQDQGFTMATTTDGSTATATIVADEEGPLVGTRDLTIAYVDKYDLAKLPMDLAVSDAMGKSWFWHQGSTKPLQLTYAGVDYAPSVLFSAWYGDEEPDTSIELRNANGAVVSKITDTGDYTLTVSGTGNWTGSLQVPLQVVPYDGLVSLADCTLKVYGNTELVNGVARPSVEVLLADTSLEEGTDYTVTYGSNTEEGQRGWVKVTAVAGSNFCGSKRANFAVGKKSKKLDKAGYALYLRTPDGGDWYEAGTQIRAYELGTDATVGPEVRVCEKQQDGSLKELDKAAYTVAYGGLSEAGFGYVTVAGTNGYSGSLSANFYVLGAARAKSTIALEGQTKVYNGKAQVYDGTVTRTGSTGAVTYAYFADEACTQRVADDNIKDAGTYYVVATLASNSEYAAAKSKPVAFVISPASVSGATVAVAGGATYTGSAHKPVVTVTLGGSRLAEGTDYTLAYRDNTNVGTAVVTVTGRGNYAGSREATFQIAKAANPMAASAKAVTAELYALSSKAATMSPLTVKSAKGKVTYRKASGASQLSVSASTGKVTVAKGTKAGTYTAQVSVAAAGDANHEPVTKTVAVTVKVVDSRKANPMKVTVAAKTAGVHALKSKAAVVAPLKAAGAKGKVTYKKASGSAQLAVNASTGKVTVKKGTKAGTYTAKVSVTAAGDASHKPATKTVKVTVKVAETRKANPMKVTAAAKTAGAKALKTKAAVVAPIAVKSAKGKVTYTKASGASQLTVSATSGKVTVKKGTKAGTYTAKLSVTAAGDASYKPATKTVTVKVVVK